MGNEAAPRALVTGAGRGIGRAIAVALARDGFCVVANDLTASDDLTETVAVIERAGGTATAVPFDVADIENHHRHVSTAWDAFGGLDCLVNNAGVSVRVRDDLLEVTPESYDRVMAINLRGPFFLTQEVARRMVECESPHFRSVVTISSTNAEFVSQDRAEYCLSKIGLSMTAQLFAVRLAEKGIGSYEVRPGVIRTSMTSVATEKYDRLIGEGLLPLARWGEPEDVARAVAALAVGHFAYSTGEVVRVDGGLFLRRL